MTEVLPVLNRAIYALHSLNKVTELWKDKDPYDLYLYVRPDLFYKNKLDIFEIINNIKDNQLYTMDRLHWGGINDCIYFGKYNTMLKIGNRINDLEKLLDCPYWAEPYLLRVINHYNITTIPIKFNYYRIRANGEILQH